MVTGWRVGASGASISINGRLRAVCSRLPAGCGACMPRRCPRQSTPWARVEDLDRRAVQQTLWEDRTLVKTWAMRGTLHLLPAAELRMWHAVLGKNGHATGECEDFLTGFVTADGAVWGRHGDPSTEFSPDPRMVEGAFDHTGYISTSVHWCGARQGMARRRCRSMRYPLSCVGCAA